MTELQVSRLKIFLSKIFQNSDSDSACLDDVCVDLVDLSGPEAAVRQSAVDNPGDGGECLRAERGEICGPEVKPLHLSDPPLHNISETDCSNQGLRSGP